MVTDAGGGVSVGGGGSVGGGFVGGGFVGGGGGVVALGGGVVAVEPPSEPPPDPLLPELPPLLEAPVEPFDVLPVLLFDCPPEFAAVSLLSLSELSVGAEAACASSGLGGTGIEK